jgi:hypothetical protein
MKARKFVVIASLILALVSALGEAQRNQEQGNKTLYPKMAPIEQYRMGELRDATYRRAVGLQPGIRSGRACSAGHTHALM